MFVVESCLRAAPAIAADNVLLASVLTVCGDQEVRIDGSRGQVAGRNHSPNVVMRVNDVEDLLDESSGHGLWAVSRTP